MTSSLPAVSVIIPALNAGATLSSALQSLVSQSAAFEAILVDGGSQDDTLAVAAAMPWLRTISAPGTSIYQALNLAIAESRAPNILWLNADDALLPGAMDALLTAMEASPDAGIIRGRPRFLENIDGVLMPCIRENEATDRPFGLELLLRGPCAINSLCIRRSVFDSIGLFRTDMRLAADREWLLRAWCVGIGVIDIPQPVYRYLVHSGSLTLDRAGRNFATIRHEHLAIIQRYLTELPRVPTPALRSSLRRWQAVEIALLTIYSVKNGHLIEAMRTVWQGFQDAPFWPVALAAELISKVVRL